MTHIRAELQDAEQYAMQAAVVHDDDRQLSETYAKLASDELDHVQRLHECAVRLIKAYKETGREVPTAMQAVWDWEHEAMVEH